MPPFQFEDGNRYAILTDIFNHNRVALEKPRDDDHTPEERYELCLDAMASILFAHGRGMDIGIRYANSHN